MSVLDDLKQVDPDGSDTAGVAPVWPWTWKGLGGMVAAFAVLTAIFTAAGLAVVEWFEPSGLGQAEADLSKDLEAARTPTWNTVADLASIPSDTFVKIGLVAILAVALPGLMRRWHDWAFLASALILEVSIYGLSSFLVGRERPPVERLTSAPTESFPSGHVAAAIVFYFGLAIIIGWHYRSTALRVGAYVVAALITVGMFLSRLYLGMHYVSDMIASFFLGALVLWITYVLLERSLAEKRTEADEVWPARAKQLDRT
ncbi:MAG: phosphatase PAP2 family protein [Acidimicrobiales bacterium]|nr:phosphatase PAP2 family protein [Acidimicrobiales bacterium]